MNPVGSFSKGMRQKLAIARALLHEPQVVFLDEPTSALDPEAAHLVREFVAELKHEGRTIFLCTHNLDEADRLCDRVAVFRTRLLALDTPAALRRQLFGRSVVFHLRAMDPAYAERVRALPVRAVGRDRGPQAGRRPGGSRKRQPAADPGAGRGGGRHPVCR